MVRPRPANSSSTLRTIAILVGVVAVLYLAREILIPLAFSITLTLILSPAVNWLTRIRLGRGVASIVVMVIAISVTAGISVVLFNQLVQVINELPVYQDNIHNKLQSLRTPSRGPLGQATKTIKDLSQELSNTQAQPVPASAPNTTTRRRDSSAAGPLPVQIVAAPGNEFQYLRELTGPFLGPLGRLGIVLIFTLFLLIEQEDLRNRLFQLGGLNRLNLMTQALADATHRVSRYLILQFLVNASFGIVAGIGLALIGVPYAALWGSVAAILRIVPYAGSPIAGLLPFLLSLAVFDHWTPPLLVLGMFVLMEILTANFLEPWLYGTHTGISSLALLLTAVFWATLWGPAGLILSTPLTVCLVVLGRHVPQFSFLHTLLGDEQALAAEAQLYQRLLAMDERGARLVVDQYLLGNSVLDLYDSVMMPAMIILERDRHRQNLDPEREEFIFLTIRELLGEIAQRKPASDHAVDRDRRECIPVGRILCVPAKDESDEIAAAMLAQLMEASGCAVLSFPADPKLQRMIHLVKPTEHDVFFVSALPPFAFLRTRAIASHLRRRFPDTKIVIGIWGFGGDSNRAVQRFQSANPDHIATSLASAMEWSANRGLVPTSSLPEPKVQVLVP